MLRDDAAESVVLREGEEAGPAAGCGSVAGADEVKAKLVLAEQAGVEGAADGGKEGVGGEVEIGAAATDVDPMAQAVMGIEDRLPDTVELVEVGLGAAEGEVMKAARGQAGLAGVEVFVIARGDADDGGSLADGLGLVAVGEESVEAVFPAAAGRDDLGMLLIIGADPLVLEIEDVGDAVALAPPGAEGQDAELGGGEEDEIEAAGGEELIALAAEVAGRRARRGCRSRGGG